MTTLTPARLWKQMTTEQRRQAASALWDTGDAKTEQMQAAAAISKHLKFRPKTVNSLDRERKARYLASVPDLPDELVARLLVLYHLAAQRPLMGAFLDALGIAHDNGLIREDAATPDATKIPSAVTAIAKQFPAHDVAIYLNTLLWQDPTAWMALENVPDVVAGQSP